MRYLLRHGATESNSKDDEKIRGWSNEGLSEEGRVHARQAAEVLKKDPPDVIFASDLQRSRETAEEISKALGGVPEIRAIPDLRTWNVGHYQGKRVKDVAPDLTRLQERYNMPVPGGETYENFYKRWHRTFHQLKDVSDNSLFVLHGRQLWSLPSILTNGKLPIPYSGPPNPGDILTLDDKNLRYHHRGKGNTRSTPS